MFNLYLMWFFLLMLFSVICFLGFLMLLENNLIFFLEWNITLLNSSSVSMTFLIDWMSMIFISCVFLISSMVLLYSIDYMAEDKFNYRFLILILMFIISMLLMIFSPNMISILLGWDGLGLVSYCLVIYYGSFKSYNAGLLTLLINRVGDVCILLSLYYMFSFGSWSYVFYLLFWEDWMLYWLIFIIIASFTKSAQIPFSSWLPAAMAAPTPVSSLVHSSTLVTAGVYLLIRFSDLFKYINVSVFLFLSMLTMFMAGLGANFEYDLKKIIALSTLSQLGMMMLILLMGSSLISFFHLLTHAFFKALLFLCAGLIIHCMNDSQDIRHMGNLIHQLPYTCSCFCISSFSLCGIPFMSGFYSKDLIIEFCSLNSLNLFMYCILLLSVGLTMSYSVRLIYYCIFNHNGLFVYQSCIESHKMMYSMFFLSLFSIFGGSFLSWLIFLVPSINIIPFFSKFLPCIVIILGMYLGYELSFFYWFFSFKGFYINYLYNFVGSMWFLPIFSTMSFNLSVLYLSKNYLNFNDSMWGEFIVSRSLLRLNRGLSMSLSFLDNHNLKIYMLLFLVFMFYIFVF
uniref:NADH dehydrogenase subunit 5 n=1 Tax=Urochelellus acutihumeralis TaxID=3020186 RepID=UPI002410BEEF|nr:NADH dehydrogenase subunit 5 [Urochelellus acutihumeralis]WEM32422.1 NADH dehydrogenase subunit 5 [Urochelellus acutihumeralis]